MRLLVKAFGLFLMALLLNGILSGFATVPVWFCWNYVMPDIFPVEAITFRQAWALTLLCYMLFNQPSEAQ